MSSPKIIKPKLIKVAVNDKGAYFIYEITVQRGIKGKTKSKVKELLIHEVPLSDLDNFCKKEGLRIEDSKTGKVYGFKEVLK